MSPKQSKFLSLVLRHQPEKVGLTLDSAGWVDVDKLLTAIKWTKEELDDVVQNNDKKRFEYSTDALRIRASQGHSVEVDLQYAPAKPPAVLYHGTVDKVLPAILAEGLKPMSRVHVHLSADVKTATIVGSRRGAPVILEIDAQGVESDGHAFYLSTNGVWLTDAVPASRIRRM